MAGANIMGADHQSSMPNRNQLMKKKTDDMMHVGKPQADMKSELKSTAEQNNNSKYYIYIPKLASIIFNN